MQSQSSSRRLAPRHLLHPRRVFVAALAVVGLLATFAPVASAEPAGPTTPSDLRLTAVDATSVSVAWSASTSIGHRAIEGYDLYLDTTKVAASTLLAYTFAGLNCGRSYKIDVVARDDKGATSAPATILAATSPCVDSQPPAVPTGIVQVASTATSATVSWTPSSDNMGVIGYGAYQGGIRIGQTSLTSYTFSNVACGTSTTIGLDAYDAAGNRSAVASFVVTTSACGDTQPPTAPTGLTPTASTDTSISLKWNASTDNVGIAYYGVRSNGSELGRTTSTSYTLSGLSCATSYSISVAAYDATGNHTVSTSATMATNACPPAPTSGDTTPPTVPTNLKIAAATQTSISVSWSPSTDNVGVAGYGAYAGGVRVGQSTLASNTFTGLSCGKSYTLGVDAYDAAGNRSAQASMIASTSACSDTQPPTQPTSVTLSNRTATSISLTWTASTDNVGVVGYGVYKGGTLASTSTTASYTLTGLSCGSSYTIGVDAYDGAGNRSTQATVMMSTAACSDTQPPSAPTNLAVSNTTQTSATLSWVASSDNVGVAGYDLFANSTKVGTTTSKSYSFSGLTCGVVNSLGVEAFDAAGNRSTRSVTSVTTAACSTITPAMLPSAIVGMSYGQQLTAGGSSGPYTFQVAQGTLPAGISLLAGGLHAGTPTASGSFAFSVVAKDASGATAASQPYSLSVAASTSSSLLTWAPPTLVNPITVPIQNTGLAAPSLPGQNTSQPWVVYLAANTDYVLQIDHRQQPAGNIGGLSIVGGRNVVIIGGEMTIPDPGADSGLDRAGLVFHNQTSTVHVEGLLINGNPLYGIVLDSATAIFQVENVRVEGVYMWQENFSAPHSDAVITWVSPPEIRIDKLTGAHDNTGLAFYGNNGNWSPTTVPALVKLKRVNIRASVSTHCTNTTKSLAADWMVHEKQTRMELDQIYSETGWGRANITVSCPLPGPNQITLLNSWHQQSAGNNTEYTPSTTVFGNGISEGSYVDFTNPTGDNVYGVNGVNARVYYGVPPNGDFVPTGVAGTNYLSPGYGG